MKTKILFPCDPFNSKEVDSNFQNEYQISKTLGIDYFLYDHDLLADEEKVKFIGLSESEGLVIIRGWMMKPKQYEMLYNALVSKGQTPITTPANYVSCHYLKESYKYIENYTAKTLFTQSFDKETLGAMFDQFPNGIVLKDYVKSEKGIPGLFVIPKETSHEQLEGVVKRFIEARGKLFNVGVAFREFIELSRIEGEVNEWRVFVFKDKSVAIEQNSSINVLVNHLQKPSQNLINSVIEKMKGVSSFYTIDFAEKAGGGWIVVETGDGQVSGLAPKQNPIGLYNAFMTKE